VCRETTERSEAVDVGLAQLAGTSTERVLASMEWAYQKSASKNRPQLWPFGRGTAAQLITEDLVLRGA
jgi:UDP-N-acetylglucosamine 2-epimerase